MISHTVKSNLVFHAAGWYSTTREPHEQWRNLSPHATAVGGAVFAIERKQKAPTVVGSVSPTEAALGLRNWGGYFSRFKDLNFAHPYSVFDEKRATLGRRPTLLK